MSRSSVRIGSRGGWASRGVSCSKTPSGSTSLGRAPEDLTEAVNRAVAAAGEGAEEFVSTASQRVLERVEW